MDTWLSRRFAAHLAATEGAMAILDSNNAPRLPIGALGLACASVSVVYCPREIVLTILRWRGH